MPARIAADHEALRVAKVRRRRLARAAGRTAVFREWGLLMKQIAGFPQAAILAVALMTSSATLALNLLPLGDLPLRHMTEEDREILKTAVIAALDQTPDGTTAEWSNPATGAFGELTPRTSFERSGRSCRDLEVANSAGGRSNRLVVTLCRQPDGEWRIEQQ